MKFSVSLKENYAFRRLYAKGKSAATPLLVVYFRRNGRAGNRLGLTVGTKVGKAVTRNQIRRRLREIYRLSSPRLIDGVDMVIVARAKCVNAKYSAIEKAFISACRQLGVLSEDVT